MRWVRFFLKSLTIFFLPLKTLASPVGRAENLLDTLENSVEIREVLPPEQIIANLIEVTLSVVGVILIILVIYGGYLWGTAGGNEERAKEAQRLIRNAVIGVIIVFGAYFITAFVVGKIGEVAFEPLFPF